MTKGSKEWYEMIKDFERSAKNSSVYGLRFDKPSKDESVPKHVVYNDGKTNEMFMAFQWGYANARCKATVGDLV